MARNRSSRTLIYILLVLAAAEFIALAALLLPESGDSSSSSHAEPPPAEEIPVQEDASMPEWLLPSPPQEDESAESAVSGLSAPEILAGSSIVAHGLGEIDGVTTLNCLEGFLQQYQDGVRIFEADLRLTSDLQVVLRHDWRGGWQPGISEQAVPDLEEFRKKPLLETYTPLTFQDLLLLMEEYPDVCIITDTKYTDAEIVTLQFQAMLADAEELGLTHLFDRMVIQVYNQLMFTVVDHLHPFPHYLYTLYTQGFDRTMASFREIAGFCRDNGILGVTMWDYWWRSDFASIARDMGVRVYVHTVNDAAAGAVLLDSGVSGLYSDRLVPADLEGAAQKQEGA